MAMYLQTKERECVEALIASIKASGRQVGSIIYDGVHVEKEEGDLLEVWSRGIYKATGLEMALACKAFDCNPVWVSDVAAMATSGQLDYNDDWMERCWSYEDMNAKFEERDRFYTYNVSNVRGGHLVHRVPGFVEKGDNAYFNALSAHMACEHTQHETAVGPGQTHHPVLHADGGGKYAIRAHVHQGQCVGVERERYHVSNVRSGHLVHRVPGMTGAQRPRFSRI